MKQIKLDRQDDAIKRFIRTLPIEPDGVELQLNGKVICKVVGPHPLTVAERETLLERGHELVRRARLRNKRVPAKVLEREVEAAVDDVRRQRK